MPNSERSTGTTVTGQIFGSPVEDEDEDEEAKSNSNGWKFTYNPSPEEKKISRKPLKTAKSFPIREMLKYSQTSAFHNLAKTLAPPPRITTPVRR